MGNIDGDTARTVIYILETASNILCNFAQMQGKDIYARLKPRPRKGGAARNANQTDAKKQKLNGSLKKLVEKYKDRHL